MFYGFRRKLRTLVLAEAKQFYKRVPQAVKRYRQKSFIFYATMLFYDDNVIRLILNHPPVARLNPYICNDRPSPVVFTQKDHKTSYFTQISPTFIINKFVLLEKTNDLYIIVTDSCYDAGVWCGYPFRIYAIINLISILPYFPVIPTINSIPFSKFPKTGIFAPHKGVNMFYTLRKLFATA